MFSRTTKNAYSHVVKDMIPWNMLGMTVWLWHLFYESPRYIKSLYSMFIKTMKGWKSLKNLLFCLCLGQFMHYSVLPIIVYYFSTFWIGVYKVQACFSMKLPTHQTKTMYLGYGFVFLYCYSIDTVWYYGRKQF